VGIIFGIIHMLIPEAWRNLIGWPIKEPMPYRLIGAAILGVATSSWLAYNEAAWERVKIVVEMEIVWTVLGALVLLGGLFFASLPAIGWVNVIILGGFAVAFGLFFVREAPVVLRPAHR
jgi:hypothetical protein